MPPPDLPPPDAPPPAAEPLPEPPPLPAADLALLAAITARGESSPPPASAGPLLATAVLFLAFGGLHWGWSMVAYLTVAIALHEIGHVIAMRVFGYKNVRMLFIPLFGGLATGEPRELDATKNALVALAGPLFGLVTAGLAAGLALALGSPLWLVTFAWVSLLLNAFNLIPFVPLDGGQIANETLFSRYPALELGFRLLAIVGLGWFALDSQAWLLGAVVVFMGIATPTAYRRARIIRDARRDPAWQSRPLDHTAVAELRAMVGEQFRGVAPEKYAAALPAHVHGLWLGIRKRFPGPGKTTALLAAYGFTAVILSAALAFFLVRSLPKPEF